MSKRPYKQNGGAGTPPLVTRKPITSGNRTARQRINHPTGLRQRQYAPLRARWEDETGCLQSATIYGREAQALRALVVAGARGITSLDMSSWAIRLASYIHDLRHVYGLPIGTQREPHTIRGIAGTHARYRLLVVVYLTEL